MDVPTLVSRFSAAAVASGTQVNCFSSLSGTYGILDGVADKKKISNVLANRYASPELTSIWSAEDKILAERRLWIAVMKAQKEMGVDKIGRAHV